MSYNNEMTSLLDCDSTSKLRLWTVKVNFRGGWYKTITTPWNSVLLFAKSPILCGLSRWQKAVNRNISMYENSRSAAAVPLYLFITLLYSVTAFSFQTVANEPFAVNIFRVVVCPPLYINRPAFLLPKSYTAVRINII